MFDKIWERIRETERHNFARYAPDINGLDCDRYNNKSIVYCPEVE